MQAQNRRVKALEADAATAYAAADAARAGQAAAEARLRDAATTIATLRKEAADSKVALAAHVAELLATQQQLAQAQDALRHGLEAAAGVSDL